MPELPDVEGFRRVLASCGQDHRIARIDVVDAGVLHGVTAGRLRRALEGRRFAEPGRHGKWLLAPTHGDGDGDGDGDGPTVLLHFGMTGRLACERSDEPAQAHDRVTFTLDDGRQLRYRDQRKLQGLWLAASATEAERVMGDQGPDALSLGRGRLTEVLAGRRGRIKGTLLDQSVISGLGNLLGDEILWQARINPTRPTGRLTAEEERRLDTVMRRVLRTSVRAGHVPTRPSWLTGHRYDEEPDCPRCGGALAFTRTAGRSTAFCPNCQPDGGP